MSVPATWEEWIEAEGPPAGAEAPSEFADQLALHRALVALHGEPVAEQRLRAAVRAALATDSGRWRRRLRRDPRLHRHPRGRRPVAASGRWWLVAAAVVLCAGGLWLVRTPDPRPVVADGVVAGTQIGSRPPIGRELACDAGAELLWADGSTARCAGDARLRLGASGMLEIVHGPLDVTVVPRARGTAFTITTPHQRIEVLGTRFSVTVADAGTELDVTEGRVAIVGRGGRREASAGSRMFFAPDGEAWTVVRRFVPMDAATLALLRVGTRGTWRGRDALLAGPLPNDVTLTQICLGEDGLTLVPAIPGGRVVADLALDRQATVRLWLWDRAHGTALSLTLPIPADGTFHRVEADLATLRDQAGAPAAADGQWENLILIVEDPDAVLAATRIELITPD